MPWEHSKYTWKTPAVSSALFVRVIGEEIRNARQAAGLSQEELGFKANVSRNYVSMVELNQNSPTLETLMRLCQAIGVRAATLIDKVEREIQKKQPAPKISARKPARKK